MGPRIFEGIHRTWLISVGSFALASSTACSDKIDLTVEVRGGGAEYKFALVQLINNSDRIEATEHSDELDLTDPQTHESIIPTPIVYGVHIFDAADRAFFLSTIESLDPATQDAFPACVAEVHHTLHFYSGRRLVDTMDICFQCGEIIWSRAKADPPWSIYTGLENVIEHIGFKTKRDWSALASSHRK